jgi:hypothetical protein
MATQQTTCWSVIEAAGAVAEVERACAELLAHLG